MNTVFCNKTQSNRAGQCSDCHCGPAMEDANLYTAISLPIITDEIWLEYNETDLVTWDRESNKPHWTQIAVDFACTLKSSKQNDMGDKYPTCRR